MPQEHKQNRMTLTPKSFVGPAVVIATAGMMLVYGWYANLRGDFIHMFEPMQNLLENGIGGVYVEGVEGTSLTGWLLLTLAPFVIGKNFFSDDISWVLAGLVSAPLLVGGVRYAARAIWPSMSVERAWTLAAISLVLPTTVSSWVEYYHPQDVAAVGLMLFGLGLAAKHRWVAAGAMLGFAIVTRHWVLLVALAITPLAGSKNVLRYIAGGAAVTAVCVLPLIVTGNEGLFYAVSAQGAAITDQTLLGRVLNGFDSTPELLQMFFRVLPLLGASGLAVLAWRKKWDTSYIVPVAVTAMTLRMLFETAPYTYYWVPIPVLLLILTKNFYGATAGIALSLFVWPVRPFGESPFGEILVALLVALFGILVIFATWQLHDAGERDKKVESFGSSTPKWLWVTSSVVAVSVFVIGFPFVGNERQVFFSDMEASRESQEKLENMDEASPVNIVFQDGKLSALEGTSFDGDQFSFTAGAPTVVGVFSHWCESCSAEAPEFLRWSQQQDAPLSTFGIFTNSDKEKGNWPTGLWLLSMEWDINSVADDEKNTLGSAFGFTEQPVFLVFDTEGKLVDRWEGAFDPQRALLASGAS